MQGNFLKMAGMIFILLQSFLICKAQISPGELSAPHSKLEGISNCTQCHVLGDKVTNEKCLTCHTDILRRISLQKGYHSSAEVKGKQCTYVTANIMGRIFNSYGSILQRLTIILPVILIRTARKKKLQGMSQDKYITDQKLKAKKNTYLGLDPACLSCHADYHRKTLSSACLDCHNPNSFIPASKFDHAGQDSPCSENTTVLIVSNAIRWM